MKRLALLIAFATLAAPALAQNGYNYQTMPLGGGWNSFHGTGPNGSTFQGTQVPMGGGWSTTTWQDNSGNQTQCTTIPMGGGMASTTCQ